MTGSQTDGPFCGFIPYDATFLVAGLARTRCAERVDWAARLHVYTHDRSLGEDGPTHKTIEHLAPRYIPATTWAPLDA